MYNTPILIEDRTKFIFLINKYSGSIAYQENETCLYIKIWNTRIIDDILSYLNK